MGGEGSGRKPYRGAPTKLTPELQTEIVRLVEAGNYLETAAAAVGVRVQTVRKWLRDGVRMPRGRYGEFTSVVKKAEARAEASALVRLRQFGKLHWQCEAWYLERKFPTKWGRQDRPSDDANTEVQRARQVLQDKEVRDLLDRAASQLSVAGDSGSASGEG